jgi:molybdopterin molybdotransferase
MDIGARIFFDKVSIRPGKPTVFARKGETCFFGLPGNPVSTSVTYSVFARPAIRKMMGARSPVPNKMWARAGSRIKDASSRRGFLPGSLTIENGVAMAQPLKWGGSSDLVAFMAANCLIIVPEEVHDISPGEGIEVLIIERIQSGQ